MGMQSTTKLIPQRIDSQAEKQELLANELDPRGPFLSIGARSGDLALPPSGGRGCSQAHRAEWRTRGIVTGRFSTIWRDADPCQRRALGR